MKCVWFSLQSLGLEWVQFGCWNVYSLAAGIGPECVYILLLESGTGMYGFATGIWDRNRQLGGWNCTFTPGILGCNCTFTAGILGWNCTFTISLSEYMVQFGIWCQSLVFGVKNLAVLKPHWETLRSQNQNTVSGPARVHCPERTVPFCAELKAHHVRFKCLWCDQFVTAFL